MAKNLLIVESPAKAKTIEKYLGKDFTVKSSYGHIRDLSKKDALVIDKGVSLKYEVSPEKTKVVKELKTALKKVDEVWLATDEDREGEAISWHLCKVLGLDETSTKRIVFREITEKAIKSAIQEPRTVDLNVVDAQQARRVLDRLVGFELSGLLWKKIKGKLSAGRVQSVAVKLIVEKERSIQSFNTTPFFKVVAVFSVIGKNGKPQELKAELARKIPSEQEALEFLNSCKRAEYKIEGINVKPAKKKPASPFTTSTLQQEASRKLGFSVSRTMSTAQRLYEAGLITYMRTDSISLSEQAIGSINEYVKSEYGDQYAEPRRFKSKNENAQEAHEAIRPAYIDRFNVATDKDQQRLYELIWKRTIASQMSDAKLEKTNVDISISTNNQERLQALGEVLIFDGFLKVYLESKEEEEEEEAKGMLPPLKEGQVLDLNNINARQRFTRPPARFTEASLVKRLEELGIGRPSTYAPTITKITEPSRGYVVKETREGVERAYAVHTLKENQVSSEKLTEITGAEKSKLFPTDMGMIVSDFLENHFDQIMDYSFTASVEKKFDEISHGKTDWEEMITDFYHPFHEHVEETIETADRATGERILGKDPESGYSILVRMAKYGPVAQIGTPEELGEDVKPRYANLRKGLSLETVSLEDALDMFKFPLDLGEYDSLDVLVSEGRYGPYIKFGDTNVSIPKGTNPHEITLESAVEYIEQKRKEDAPIYHFNDKPVTKGAGRFGPFLKYEGMYINIPKRYNPEMLSDEEIVELIEAKIEKEANRYVHNWPEEKTSIQNGRWGPFIKWQKKNVKLPLGKDGKRMTSEEAKELSFEDVVQLIQEEHPTAFKKKKKAATKKKAPAKKKTTTKKKK